MLEYFSGLQLRALSEYEPSIPDWWWKRGVLRRTQVVRERVPRRKLYQEVRDWIQEQYYAIRGVRVYRHVNYTREGEPAEHEYVQLDLPDEALALRERGNGASYPVVLLANGDQYSLGFSGRREMIPLRQPYRLREFELH